MILDFTRVPTVDVSAAMAVETVTVDAIAAGRQLVICGANAAVNEVLESICVNHPGIVIYDNLHDALLYAKKKVTETPNQEVNFKAVSQS